MTPQGRIVIKLGSSTLTTEEGRIDELYLKSLVAQIDVLRKAGNEIVIVSSGAIVAGLHALSIRERPRDIASLQAAASVGSIVLARAFSHQFERVGLTIGQVLLTKKDTEARESYLLARNTFERLLDLGVIPLVNENDTVAVEEICFGDNDTLAALVGTMIKASLVVLMSDIDGFYDADPNGDGTLLDEVGSLSRELMEAAGPPGSVIGSGGMATKIEAARVLMRAGIPMVICDGRRPHVLTDIVRGKRIGTTFEGGETALRGKKLWIALGQSTSGEIIIDEGAYRALRKEGKSLLAAGIIAARGEFVAGDAVLLRDEHGLVVGRGLVSYSLSEVEKTRRLHSDDVAQLFPHLAGKPVIHADHLVVL